MEALLECDEDVAVFFGNMFGLVKRTFLCLRRDVTVDPEESAEFKGRYNRLYNIYMGTFQH